MMSLETCERYVHVLYNVKLLEQFEIGNTSPRTDRRRHVLRYLHVSMQRQDEKFVVCEWGCKTWVKLGQNQFNHEMNDCPKRVVQCIQSCSLRMKFEEWKSASSTNGMLLFWIDFFRIDYRAKSLQV